MLRDNYLTTLLIPCFTLLLACGTTIEFPTSSLVPAADIEAKTSTDKFGNHIIEIKTEHLADPQRLSPPRSIYVVWADTKENGLVNLGQLHSESGDKAELEASTPFEPVTLFITAEDKGAVEIPTGVEISRVEL